MLLLKSLTQRFNSLQKDVDLLKEKEAHRSMSEMESEPSRREMDTVGDAAASTSRAHERHASTSQTRDEQHHLQQSSSQRHRRQSPDTSRSRSRSLHTDHKGKSRARSSLRRPNCSWGEWMSDSKEEQMDYTKRITFSDSEAEDQPPTKLAEVSEKTKQFLQDKCTRRVLNAEHLELRDHYPLQKVPATKTPQLDPIMKPEASAATKAIDKQLGNASAHMSHL